MYMYVLSAAGVAHLLHPVTGAQMERERETEREGGREREPEVPVKYNIILIGIE